jgi:hypothetical protein
LCVGQQHEDALKCASATVHSCGIALFDGGQSRAEK